MKRKTLFVRVFFYILATLICLLLSFILFSFNRWVLDPIIFGQLATPWGAPRIIHLGDIIVIFLPVMSFFLFSHIYIIKILFDNWKKVFFLLTSIYFAIILVVYIFSDEIARFLMDINII